MRLWTLHPALLDRQGFLGQWREALAVQAIVLQGKPGYRSHPQVQRVLTSTNPQGFISDYLKHLLEEAARRRYNFDFSKRAIFELYHPPTVGYEQLFTEHGLLLRKLLERGSLNEFKQLRQLTALPLHPTFRFDPSNHLMYEGNDYGLVRPSLSLR